MSGRLVRGVVVHDQMDDQVLGDSGLDRVEELAELGGPVPAMTLPDDFAGLHVERREERGRPVAHVVVGPPLDLPRSHGQQGLAPIQRLDLRLLVHTQHQRAIRRVQIEPDDVPDFVDEERVAGQLERVGAMGLQAKRPPDAADRALAQATSGGHRAGAPVRRVARGRFERPRHNPLDRRVGDSPGRAGPGLIEQPVHPLDQEPLPPLADGVLVQPQFARDRAVRLARGTLKHHVRALGERLGGGATTRPPLSVSCSSGVSANGGSGRPRAMRVLLCTGERAERPDRSE